MGGCETLCHIPGDPEAHSHKDSCVHAQEVIQKVLFSYLWLKALHKQEVKAQTECIWLIHFVVQQKLTQHCEAIILQ